MITPEDEKNEHSEESNSKQYVVPSSLKRKVLFVKIKFDDDYDQDCEMRRLHEMVSNSEDVWLSLDLSTFFESDKYLETFLEQLLSVAKYIRYLSWKFSSKFTHSGQANIIAQCLLSVAPNLYTLQLSFKRSYLNDEAAVPLGKALAEFKNLHSLTLIIEIYSKSANYTMSKKGFSLINEGIHANSSLEFVFFQEFNLIEERLPNLANFSFNVGKVIYTEKQREMVGINRNKQQLKQVTENATKTFIASTEKKKMMLTSLLLSDYHISLDQDPKEFQTRVGILLQCFHFPFLTSIITNYHFERYHILYSLTTLLRTILQEKKSLINSLILFEPFIQNVLTINPQLILLDLYYD